MRLHAPRLGLNQLLRARWRPWFQIGMKDVWACEGRITVALRNDDQLVKQALAQTQEEPTWTWDTFLPMLKLPHLTALIAIPASDP